MQERSLVVIKPDGVARGIVGEILTRFEKTGLKLVALKMLTPSRELADTHYPKERREFIEGMGNKTLENYKEMGLDAKQDFGHADAHKIGIQLREWLAESLSSAPVVAMVLEGPHAIELIRKLAGHTLPLKSAPGTIRGDYSFDSSYLGNVSKRPIRNIIHASGNKEEAELEISLWFKKSEIQEYKSIHQDHMTQS